MAHRLHRRDAGFTLMELLVAILVVGILAAIAIPVFLNQRKKGVDASIKADLRQIAMLQEMYIADHPGEQGTNDVSALGAFRKSDAFNRFYTTYNANGGHCTVGRSTRGTDGGSTSAFWWWDSLAGGLITPSGPTDVLPAGAKACAFTREPWSAVF